MRFKNTENGLCEYTDDKLGFYTFPEGALIQFEGFDLDISQMKVACYTGRFDNKSTEYFVEAVSKIPSSQATLINAPIFINDNNISGTGYPSSEEFYQYNIPFITSEEYKTLQNTFFSFGPPNPSDPRLQKHQSITRFIYQWIEDSREKITKKLNQILDKNTRYPLHISLIYDDRLLKHSTHIVLEYLSRDNCILKIDNTISLVSTLPQAIVDGLRHNYQLDILEAKETFSKEKPTFLKFENKHHPEVGDIELELSRPIPKILFGEAYARMAKILKENLNIPLKKITINPSPLNQKLMEECVSFSLQNKLHLMWGELTETNELLKDKALRFRAEQAILCYLLNGNTEIPHLNQEDCSILNIHYSGSDWYPNYTEMCALLNQKLGSLPTQILEELLMDMELDNFSLAPALRPVLFDHLKSKADLSNYEAFDNTEISEAQGKVLEEFLAPGVIYRNDSHTFFMKKIIKQDFNHEALMAFLEEPSKTFS